MNIYIYIIYDQFAEVIKLKPLELDLKRLEDLSQAIVLEFNDMKTRADEMHSTNGIIMLNV